MRDVLEFIFRDFWTWLGSFLLLAVLVQFRFSNKENHFNVNLPEKPMDINVEQPEKSFFERNIDEN